MLVNLNEVYQIAERRKMAIPAINAPNLESIIAAIEVAEKLEVPLILSHAQLHDSVMPIEIIGPIMLEMAKKAKVPVVVHLDHGESFEFCKKAIDMGFTSVMIDASALPYEENIAASREVVEYAHKHHATVEAELGMLPNRESGGVSPNSASLYTDPDLVPDFVKRTGVDCLAIAFGTAHGIYKVKPVLNFDIISEIRKRSDIPLVMHGGSGLSDDDYREAIKRGIRKINYYTYMSYDGYAAVKAMVEKQPTGFFHDLCTVATKAEADRLLHVMAVFAGK